MFRAGPQPTINVCAQRSSGAPCFTPAFGGGIGFAPGQAPMNSIMNDIANILAMAEDARRREIAELERIQALEMVAARAQQETLSAVLMAQKRLEQWIAQQTPCVISSASAMRTSELCDSVQAHTEPPRPEDHWHDGDATSRQVKLGTRGNRILDDFEEIFDGLQGSTASLLRLRRGFYASQPSETLARQWHRQQEDLESRGILMSARIANLQGRTEIGGDLDSLERHVRIFQKGLETFDEDIDHMQRMFDARLAVEQERSLRLQESIRASVERIQEANGILDESRQTLSAFRVGEKLQMEWARRREDFASLSSWITALLANFDERAREKWHLESTEKRGHFFQNGVMTFQQDIRRSTEEFKVRFALNAQDANGAQVCAAPLDAGSGAAMATWTEALAALPKKRLDTLLQQREKEVAFRLADESDGKYTQLQVAEQQALMDVTVNGSTHTGGVAIAVGNMPDDGTTWSQYGMNQAAEQVWARGLASADAELQAYIVANAPCSGLTYEATAVGSHPGLIRLPDFVTFQIDYFVGSVWGTFTRDGNAFFGFGVQMVLPNPVQASASGSFGWLNQTTVAPGDSNKFAGGYSGGMSGLYAGVGGGVMHSQGNGTATIIGVGVGVGLAVARKSNAAHIGFGVGRSIDQGNTTLEW